MQIVCPNCATAYEVPDAVFAGRARKLRCETCGTQWRAGPPGAEAQPESGAASPPPAAEPGRVFGRPADAVAEAEFQQAMSREALERDTAAAPEPAATSTAGQADDPFINLVMAARSRSIEFEPEPPPERRIISSPALVGTLLTLFVLLVAFLLFHAR